MLMSRRFLISAAAAAALTTAALPAMAAPIPRAKPARLSLAHLHTGERLSVTFREGRRYDPVALARISHLLRDWRTGEVCPIDPALLDLLHDVQRRLGAVDQLVSIACGYRSPQTNRMLARTRRVSRDSLHLQGKAIDLHIPGHDLAAIRDAAWSLRRGGVGFYAPRPEAKAAGFLHLDTGRVRRWGWTDTPAAT